MTTVASAASEVADPITLHWLSADEWSRLQAMRLAALRDSPRSFLSRYEAEAKFGEKRWRTEFGRGEWAFALQGGTPIGMVGVTRYSDIPPGDCYLEYLWINEESRGTGVAAAFVREVIRELADSQIGSIWLWVLDGNDVAWRFYEKLGFMKGERAWLKDHPGRWETKMVLHLAGPLPDDSVAPSAAAQLQLAADW